MNKEELSVFCEIGHPKMCAPFSLGEFSYASNGHVLVRVPRLEDVPEWEALNESAAKLFNAVDYSSIGEKLINIPAFERPEPVKCAHCNGTGKITSCPECFGERVVCFENEFNSYECECETCDGKGAVAGTNLVCEDCNGTGTHRVNKPIKVGGCLFSSHYLSQMENLPGVQIAPTEPEKANYFKWDGGDGLLMPMRA